MIFKPHIIKKCVTDITAEELKSMGIEVLLLDVDNTLSLHHSQIPAGGVCEWIEKMKLDGIQLIILSNARSARVKPFADKLGLPFVSLSKKPLPNGYFKAKKLTGIPFSETAAVGDQLFTDMLGGHIVGVKCIYVYPFRLEDKWNFKIRRTFEKIFLKIYGI